MNSFNYDTDPQKEDAKEMLRYQKTKLAKQQLIFSCFFLFLMILLGVYVVNRIMYAQYDGYIKIDQNHVRALDDIYVLKLHKRVGEHVNPGDTLYSYVLLNNIIGQYDVNHRPAVIKETADMKLQAQLARQQIPVLRTKLHELLKQMKSESNDIFYGLTDNTAQNDLKAQIEETKTEIRKQMATVAIYERAVANTRQYMHGASYDSDRAGMPYSPEGKRYNGSLIMYACAPDSGLITDIKVPANTVLFKTEEVMSMQYSNYSIANLGVMVYVPSDKVDYISRSSDVEVVVNRDITLKAHVKLLGLRVEDIPKHLLSNFSHDIDAVIAYLNFDQGQVVPYWVLNDNLPVRIRVNRLKSTGQPFSDRQFIFTNDGGAVPYDVVRGGANNGNTKVYKKNGRRNTYGR
jgi:hypothetical protein